MTPEERVAVAVPLAMSLKGRGLSAADLSIVFQPFRIDPQALAPSARVLEGRDPAPRPSTTEASHTPERQERYP